MKFDLELEKNKELSSSQMYSIIEFSLLGSTVDGIFYPPLYERSLYVFTCVVAYPELQENDFAVIAGTNVLAGWDYLLENGYIDKVIKEYPNTLQILENTSDEYVDAYQKAINSVRGVLMDMNLKSEELISQAEESFMKTLNSEDVQSVEGIMQKWLSTVPSKQE